jgi:hypothetical protein
LADRVHDPNKYDWYRARRLPKCGDNRRTSPDDDVRREGDQLGRMRQDALGTGSEAIVDVDVAALRPAQFLKRPLKCHSAGLCFRMILSKRNQHADPTHPIGLRARSQRPRRRPAKRR